jgi:rod shape-determining protein MreC
VRNQKKRIAQALAVLSIIILIILTSSAARIIRINITDTTSPALKAAHSFLGLLDGMAPFAALRTENNILRDRLDLLTRMAEETQAVRDENDRLKALLNFKKTIPYASIAAQVIGRDPSNWSDSVIIDKGTANGIKQDMAVISVRGLVGRIVEAGNCSSKILLITDPNLKVGVMIRRNRQGGVMVGRGAGRCKVVYISLDSDARPGDKIITAGFGSVFPKGILVGDIEKTGRDQARLYKYAIVKPSQDLSKLEEVLCIVK